MSLLVGGRALAAQDILALISTHAALAQQGLSRQLPNIVLEETVQKAPTPAAVRGTPGPWLQWCPDTDAALQYVWDWFADTTAASQRCPGGLEPSALGPWTQGQDGLTRACPVVVILVVPPLRRQAFLFCIILQPARSLCLRCHIHTLLSVVALQAHVSCADPRPCSMGGSCVPRKKGFECVWWSNV